MAALKPTLTRYFLIHSRINIAQQYNSLSARVKLSEIPNVCTREDWSTLVSESRAELQKYPIKLRPFYHNGKELVTSEDVVKRIQQVSHRSNHLVNTFRQLLANTEDNINELRWPGLILLMMSKGIGNPFLADNFVSKSLEDVVWSSQVTLAEIVNLLHCHLVFRKEITRLASTERVPKSRKTEHEIDRLVYSYFTSVVLYKTPTLGNCKVALLVGNILESLAKARLSDTANSQLLRSLKHWEYNAFQSQGLLLATGCQAALELAGHDDKSQQMAFEFGLSFAYAVKAHDEIQQHLSYQKSQSSTLNISSLPIALHLQNHPETLAFIYNCSSMLDNIDTDTLNAILQSHSAMDDAKLQLETYVQKAICILQELQKSESHVVLEYLIKLVKTLNNVNQN